MAVIFKTENFIVESHDSPEVDRLDGGHIKISPVILAEDRTSLSPHLAIELMRLTMVCGMALKEAMAEIGVEIGRINYQDNGNWKPELHVHLYGRARGARYQKFGDPIIPGHKDEYRALSEEDIARLKTHIRRLLAEDRFSDTSWGLN